MSDFPVSPQSVAATPQSELERLRGGVVWNWLGAGEESWVEQGMGQVLVVISEPPSDSCSSPAGNWLRTLVAHRLRHQLALGKEKKFKKPDGFEPHTVMNEQGVRISWVWLHGAKNAFERLTRVREALHPLLEDKPEALAVWFSGADALIHAEEVLYTVAVNGQALPSRKKDPWQGVRRFVLQGNVPAPEVVERARQLAAANTLARALTVLPPNELTPLYYRAQVQTWANQEGWEWEEYSLAQLREMGAGAFVAVAQGSAVEDAAIVHVRYAPAGATRRIALVGKGICFDTGGHNLKPARYMQGMHEDMNGSAVALALLQCLSRLRVPVVVDVWLALAQNSVGPNAYKQNDVVTALDGTTLEVVHTDAEGRMVLADTLVLAARGQPDLMVDFATLTGSMHTALGSRYSGAFTTSPSLADLVMSAGEQSGERMLVFPQDDDYDSALESTVADVKQCTLEGDADHILATRFLARFTADLPWVHVDLSASSHKEGLGAVATEVTGFGVRWGADFLDKWLKNPL
ncbi:MAG: leucyl aminopeptidase family protein [Ferrovum sp.]|nr:leucyl aminopeptidase family protein [Ferrovum sp.]NDU87781.1 leucyl aminopeptidase family protein [Ferrovum sp.]